MIGNEKELRLSFLLFRSRSGSTFFGDRLSRHPEVLVAPETNTVPRIYRYFKKDIIIKNNKNYRNIAKILLSDKKTKYWNISEEQLTEKLSKNKITNWESALFCLCQIYRDNVKPEAKVIVIKKSGWYYKNIDILLKTFHNSISMWVIRDPRAVYNSASHAIHSTRKKPMEKNVVKNALGWREFIKLFNKASIKWTGRVISVRYETLIAQTSEILKKVWHNLDVKTISDYEIEKILVEKKKSHLITPETTHLHKNVYYQTLTEPLEKWKRTLPNWKKSVIQFICRKGMQQFDYKS